MPKQRWEARDHCFALLNIRLQLIEATSAWAYMLHAIRLTEDDPDNYVVVHLTEDLKLGTLEVIR